MLRPLNEFAGWLRFYQFIIGLNIIFTLVVILSNIEVIFTQDEKLITMLGIIQAGLSVFYLIKIILIIEKKGTEVPELIMEYLYMIFLIAIGYFLMHSLITLLIMSRQWIYEDNTIAFAGSVQTMIWCVIWRTYFAKSKRVQSYYIEHLEEKEDQQIQNR